MTIYILNSTFFDYKGNAKIGGVESYLLHLSRLLNDNKYKVVVYQYAENEFIKEVNGITIKGVKVNINKFQKARKQLFHAFLKKEKPSYKNDIVLFGADQMICRNKFENSIAIQHGIGFDILTYKKEKNIVNIFNILLKAVGTIKKYLRFSKVKTLVAVDYNFLNWYRTQVKNINNHIVIIPNFVDLENTNNVKKDETIKIIFARRFVDYRGTKIFVEAIKEVLDLRSNIKVTIAGEGPEEKNMRAYLLNYRNVNFTKFSTLDSLKIHQQYHIAVVPSLGSEGTSLSLLEAMGGQCAVIATNVGGMTNIILDGYNGLLISPNKDELKLAILKLIDDCNLREQLGKNAFETVNKSFNKKKWDTLWLKVIKEAYENC